MELWDLYDKDRIKLDETMVRGDLVKKGTYHLVVHICIFNSNEQMLIQQRQPFKKGWPNLWDFTVGGSAVSGDDSRKAAERELYEEIGYKYSFDDKRPALTINCERGFDDVYIIQSDDIKIQDLKLQQEEVQAVKWATLDEIKELIDNELFIPYHKSFVELLFHLRNHTDTRTAKDKSKI